MLSGRRLRIAVGAAQDSFPEGTSRQAVDGGLMSVSHSESHASRDSQLVNHEKRVIHGVSKGIVTRWEWIWRKFLPFSGITMR